mgnify:CR=1 FL=1
MGSLTRLKHVEGELFHSVRDDDGKRGHDVRFVRDRTGKVTHLVIQSMDRRRVR